LFAWLNLYANYPDSAAKRDLQAIIEADIDLLLRPTRERLQADLSLDNSWKGEIGKFFHGFYDVWSGIGFQEYLFGAGTTLGSNYTRADFVNRFVAENNLFVCPICDASAYRNETRSGTYTSIDHFFPRSRYPHLAIHPLNLLPMCPTCNSGVAGQADPQAGLSGITDLVLPYHEENDSLAGRTYVVIDFRPLPENESELGEGKVNAHALTFSIKVAADQRADLSTKIECFENIYGVQKRWNRNNNLTLIDEHVFRRIRQFLLSDIERGEPLHDPQFLLERLELLMAMIDKQSLGQDPFSYMMTWWLMYHIGRLEKQKEKIAALDENLIDCASLQKSEGIEPIFAELYCWAQEQLQAFNSLRDHARKLRDRMGESQAEDIIINVSLNQ
jgi:hypothetical protein